MSPRLFNSVAHSFHLHWNKLFKTFSHLYNALSNREKTLYATMALMFFYMFYIYLDKPVFVERPLLKTSLGNVFGLLCDSDLLKSGIIMRGCPSLGVEIVDEDFIDGNYKLAYSGDSIGINGNFFFIFPAGSSHFKSFEFISGDTNTIISDLEGKTFWFYTVVRVPCVIKMPGTIHEILLTFRNTHKVCSEKIRQYEYRMEFVINGYIEIMSDSKKEMQRIPASMYDTGTRKNIDSGMSLYLYSDKLQFIDYFPEAEKISPTYLKWRFAYPDNPFLSCIVFFRNRNARYYFEKAGELNLLFLGGFLGFAIGLMWSSRNKGK